MTAWADPSPPALDVALLDRLRAASGFVRIDDLPGDPRAVAAAVDALAAFGFDLERVDGAVAYRGPSPRLCPDQIEHELGTLRVGRRVAVWSRVESTNDLAARGASTEANDGLAVLAEEQTAGRGRRGRSFVAPAGSSLLTSVLLFPPEGLAPAAGDSGAGTAWLTLVGAIAAAELASERTGRRALVKWPNDVRVDGRKLCGVLVERVLRPDGPAAAVVGIGLNVNVPAEAFPPDLRDSATSLSLLAGRTFDRSELARDLLRRLDHWYDVGLRDGPSALAPAWRSRCEHLGRPVRVTTPTGVLAGRLVDVDLEHGLSLEPAPGSGLVRVPLDAVTALAADA
ncbi:MAG: biotin--[acetyl-CoA-carboxylase] ligase [Planctomycetales bacterium 71-10]|nr:MAG: biotin--[acetyl-CoA-carboxylase] ligase [Planctomycetales bacterium 71-10]